MSDHYRKLAEECDRAETALRTQVDRNVVVHLRARQADIYERALRKIAGMGRDLNLSENLCPGSYLALCDFAQKVLERAGRLK